MTLNIIRIAAIARISASSFVNELMIAFKLFIAHFLFTNSDIIFVAPIKQEIMHSVINNKEQVGQEKFLVMIRSFYLSGR